MRTHASIWCVAVGAIGLLTSGAAADIPYFNGFETPNSVNDFLSPSGQAGVGITRVASGGGTLGYTPAAGGFYAEIHNVDNFGGPNLGYAGGTRFGTPGASSPSGFAESIDIYIDTTRWLPTSTPGSDFVVGTSPNVVHDTNPELLNFIFTVTQAGAVDISSAQPNDGTGPIVFDDLTTINKSGWYRLQTTFVPGATNIENDVSVFDLQGNSLGTAHMVSSVTPADLIGPGNMVLGPWQTGFAGDVLAIDNLQTFAVPEPAIFTTSLIGLSLLRRRR